MSPRLSESLNVSHEQHMTTHELLFQIIDRAASELDALTHSEFERINKTDDGVGHFLAEKLKQNPGIRIALTEWFNATDKNMYESESQFK